MTATATLGTRYRLRSGGNHGQDPNMVAKWLASAVKECGGDVEGTQTINNVAFVTFATNRDGKEFRDELSETIGRNWNMRKAE